MPDDFDPSSTGATAGACAQLVTGTELPDACQETPSLPPPALFYNCYSARSVKDAKMSLVNM